MYPFILFFAKDKKSDLVIVQAKTKSTARF
jgi:hypothetical protein